MKAWADDFVRIACGIYIPLLCLLAVVVLCMPICLFGLTIRAIGRGLVRCGEWVIWRGSLLKWWLEDEAAR